MILSIIIPTYNRASFIDSLLSKVLESIESAQANAEVIVLDNASTDNTKDVLNKYKKMHPNELIVKEHAINIGMEANISLGMLSASGKYTWLLSDHQVINVEEFIRLLNKLPRLNFDYAYARISQWQSIIDVGTAKKWMEISKHEKGALLFTLGNMSALIFRTSLAIGMAPVIFKCCYFSYPHLAIFKALNDESIFFQTGPITSLPNNTKKITYSYNVIESRYAKNYACLRFVLGENNKWLDKKNFSTTDYNRSFRADVFNLLLIEDGLRTKTIKSLKATMSTNRGLNLAIAVATMIVIALCPSCIRIPVAQKLKLKFKNSIL